MIVQGDLRRYELLDRLRSLRDQRFSGVLSLHPKGNAPPQPSVRDTSPAGANTVTGDPSRAAERIELFIHEGALVYARSTALRHSLPAYLLTQKLVTRDGLRDLLDEARSERTRLEEIVVSNGLLSQEDVRGAKLALSRYVAAYAFGLFPARYEASRLGGPSRQLLQWAGAPLPIERCFFRYVAMRDAPESEAEELRQCFDCTLEGTAIFDELAPILVGAFSTGNTDVSADPIVSAIARGRRTLSELLAEHDAFDVVRRVFAMHRAGMVRFRSAVTPLSTPSRTWEGLERELFERRPVVRAATEPLPKHGLGQLGSGQPGSEQAVPVYPTPENSSAMATASSTGITPSNVTPLPRRAAPERATDDAGAPAEAAVEETIETRWQSLRRGSLYDALGVSIDATLPEIRRRHRSLTRAFAVGTYSDVVLSSTIRETMARATARIDEAFRTLSSESEREAYQLKSAVADEPMRAPLSSLFRADHFAKKGERALDEHRFNDAVAHFRYAAELLPAYPHPKAELAWALFKSMTSGAGDYSAQRLKVMELLDEAIDSPTAGDVPLRIRARIARAEGHLREATEAYRRVLALNPDCTEARRAVTELELARSSGRNQEAVDVAEIADPLPVEPTPEDPDKKPTGRLASLFRRRSNS